MSTSPLLPDSVDERLAAVVVAYLQAREEGQTPTPAEWLDRYPEHATELAAFFDDQAQLEQLAQPLRKAGRAAWSGSSVPQDAEVTVAETELAAVRAVGRCYGDYEVVDEIARGGMGVVYKARQKSLNRLVALKVIRAGDLASAADVQRFRQEAETIALLDHPHIVPVYEVGEAAGQVFFAMKLIEGGRLTDHATKGAVGKAEQRSAARLVATVARAIHHAHQRGVLHRDLKPSNILLDEQGQPHVTDFGLAKRVEGDSSLTQSGAILGTPSYMAPEQARGDKRQITTATDVYGLGAVLYTLLTGRPPFQGQTVLETLERIQQHEPEQPRRKNPGLHRDLETICLKCLQKERAERYGSAEAVAEDLQSWLEDRPVQGRRPSLVVRLQRWRRRHRPLVAAGAAALLMGLVVVGASIGWVAHDRGTRQERAAKLVRDALRDAVDWQDKGRLPEALSAARRAAGVSTGADVDLALAQQVKDRLADLQLVDRLQEIRLEHGAALRDGHFDSLGTDRLYAQTFRAEGLDIESRPTEAAARLRATTVAVELAAALDHWATVRRDSRNTRDANWKALLQVACLVDPDSWRVQARQALAAGDRAGLHRLMASADAVGVRPATLDSIAAALRGNRDGSPAAESFLRAAQRHYPDDFWLNDELFRFYALRASAPSPKEAVPFAVAMVALRPLNPGARLNLAEVLRSAGRVDDAIAELHETIRLKPDYAEAHNNLGWALKEKGLWDEAIAEYRQAIRFKQSLAKTHRNLGDALVAKGRLDSALTEFREAIRLDKHDADAHNSLGNALRAKTRLDDAIAEYREAIGLKKDCAEFHDNLGLALAEKGQLDEAVAEHRAAIRIKKNLPEAHFNLGNVLRRKGQHKQAVAEYQRAIRLKNDYADAHVNLGLALQGQGGLDEAIAEYRKAIRIDKASPIAHVNLGSALRAKGEPDSAIAEFQKAIQLRKNLAEAHRNLGLAFQDKGLLDNAVAEFREAVHFKANFAEAHANLGAALLDKGQWDEAIAECREAIRHKSDYPEPHSNLGAALYQKGRLDEAIAEFRQAIRFKNNYPEAHNNLGLALRRKGLIDRAIAEFREAIRLKDDYTDAYNNLGVLLNHKGRLDEAIGEFRHALRLKKDFAEAHSNLGVALALKGRPDEAIAEFRAASILQKDDAELHNNLGSAYLSKGQLEQAVAEYRQAIRLRRDYPEAHRNLGAALDKKGQLAEAIAEYRQAIRLKKDFAEAHHGLAVTLHANGRLDEAIAEYQKAIQLGKDDAEAHCNLGRALTEKGRLVEAIADFREAIRLNKNYTDAHFNLASALASQGRLDEAVAELRRAIRLNHEFAEAHCNLAQILTTQGRFHEALAEYRRGHALGTRIPGWSYPSAEWLRRAESLAQLDERLAAFVAGRIAPKDTAERLRLAWLCQQPYKALYAASARWYRDAFAAQPKLADDLNAQHRYNAACAAALAGSGKSQDQPRPDASERRSWRQQALAWLQADLTAYARLIAQGPTPAVLAALQQRLEHWQQDADLAGVRGEAALAKLPQAERAGWRKLWAEVAHLSARTPGASDPNAAAPTHR